MAKKFHNRFKTILDEANSKLIKLIETKGDESKFSSDLCLKIKNDDLMFNLDGGRYTVEVRRDHSYRDIVELIDNSGYSYSYYVLPADEFLLIADHLIEVYSKKRKRK